jgi:hypothetical protein
MSVSKMLKTEWILDPESTADDPEYVQTEYGFHWLQGNRRPYFSITGVIARKHERGGELIQGGIGQPGRWDWDSGGCIHETIERVFPHLSFLIKWHCVDDTGIAMHYAANARYWLEKHFGVYRMFAEKLPAVQSALACAREPGEGRRDGEPEPLSAFKNTIRFGVVASDSQHEPPSIEDPAGREKYLNGLAQWLECRRPFLLAAMQADMKRAGIPYITAATYAMAANQTDAGAP